MKIKVKVKLNSGRQEVLKKDGFYLVCLKKSPRDGKANEELVKVLKKYFGKTCKILKGFRSREKVVVCGQTK